ncbi:hypothetical protein [Haladaptatus halobius]|uniref:hypothetical protein n=1 Tax=Haladaptatus halobius TaxID=2884875 RepID=UPI001D09E052|nr:hypothetical protein [Haladaptatus halobius]
MVLTSYLLLTAVETVLLENEYELPKLRKAISVMGGAFAVYAIASFVVGRLVGFALSANAVSPQAAIYSFWMAVPILSIAIYDGFFRAEPLLSRR